MRIKLSILGAALIASVLLLSVGIGNLLFWLDHNGYLWVLEYGGAAVLILFGALCGWNVGASLEEGLSRR